MDRARFQRLVAEALDSLPPRFARRLENIAVVVEDEPSAAQLEDAGLDPRRDTLYGLYEGVPLPERPHDFTGLPDRITIFAGPLLRDCRTRAALVREIRTTVVHEVAHFFGLEERHIRRLGY